MQSKKQAMWRSNTEGEPIRRHVLKDMLPLDTPLSMDIEAASMCCLRCKYCPNSLSDEKRRVLNIGQNGLMPYSLFEDIVEQCKAFPHRLKNIRFAGFGEPLLNHDLAQMVSTVKREKVADTVTIFTNGIPLTHALSEELVKAGVDTFLFDIQGINAEDYARIANTRIDYGKLHENIRYLHGLDGRGKIFIKTFKFIIEGREDRFFGLYENFSDEIGIENVYEISPEVDFTGMITDEKETCGVEFISSDYCSYPWYQMAINSKGDVTACPLPASKSSNFLGLGNINEVRLADIWRGRKLNEIRRKLLEARHSIKECRNCKATADIMPQEDRIDEIVPQLLEHCKKCEGTWDE